MSEERVDGTDEQKSNCRRSRKDEAGRNYICGCGKKYLSYPALYTHIKTKHDGNQPEGTKKTMAASLRKAKPNIDEKVLREVCTEMKLEQMGILEQLDGSVRGHVPSANRICDDTLNKDTFTAFLAVIKNLPINLYKKSALDSVLVVFLLNVGEYVCESFYQVYLKFVKWFRACYYDHGGEIFEAYDRVTAYGDNKIRNFSSEECKNAPLIADFFIRFFLPTEESDPNMLTLFQHITYDFCHWMLEKKLTSLELIREKEPSPLNKEAIYSKMRGWNEEHEESFELEPDSDQMGEEELEP